MAKVYNILFQYFFFLTNWRPSTSREQEGPNGGRDSRCLAPFVFFTTYLEFVPRPHHVRKCVEEEQRTNRFGHGVCSEYHLSTKRDTVTSHRKWGRVSSKKSFLF
jgi:hypothetical protein